MSEEFSISHFNIFYVESKQLCGKVSLIDTQSYFFYDGAKRLKIEMFRQFRQKSIHLKLDCVFSLFICCSRVYVFFYFLFSVTIAKGNWITDSFFPLLLRFSLLLLLLHRRKSIEFWDSFANGIKTAPFTFHD